jgi:hypothetical protein
MVFSEAQVTRRMGVGVGVGFWRCVAPARFEQRGVLAGARRA